MMDRSSGAKIYFDGEKNLVLSMQFDAPLKTDEQRSYSLTVTTPQPGETRGSTWCRLKWITVKHGS